MARTHWGDLTPEKKRLVITLAGTDLALKLAAWHFLYHEDADDIRGPKWAWTAASFIGIAGPLAFLVAGRKKG